MEANRKRRSSGFMKGKLIMSFQRAAKSSSTVQYSSKVKPNHSSPSTASVGFLVHQDYVVSQPKQKVMSFIVPADNSRDLISSQYDNYLYGVAADDETVDKKAATYISFVQERFKLERMKSERKKCQTYVGCTVDRSRSLIDRFPILQLASIY